MLLLKKYPNQNLLVFLAILLNNNIYYLIQSKLFINTGINNIKLLVFKKL